MTRFKEEGVPSGLWRARGQSESQWGDVQGCALRGRTAFGPTDMGLPSRHPGSCSFTRLLVGAGGTVLATLLGAAAEEELVAEARFAGTLGGFEWTAAFGSPIFERPSSSLHSARNCSKDEVGVPP